MGGVVSYACMRDEMCVWVGEMVSPLSEAATRGRFRVYRSTVPASSGSDASLVPGSSVDCNRGHGCTLHGILKQCLVARWCVLVLSYAYRHDSCWSCTVHGSVIPNPTSNMLPKQCENAGQ